MLSLPSSEQIYPENLLLWLLLWRTIMYPDFIYSDDWSQKELISLKRSKHCFGIDIHIRFLSTVSNCSTHQADTFLTLNFSCKILIVVPYGYGLCYFVHFSSAISKNHVVDLFNDFLGNHIPIDIAFPFFLEKHVWYNWLPNKKQPMNQYEI